MKTVRIKIYKFNELSKKAQQVAIDKWREDETYDWIFDEAVNTLDKFAKIFSININHFNFEEPYSNRYSFEMEDTILELSGQRLATYIWNNYKREIFKPKIYSKLVKTFKDGTPIPVSKEHPAGFRLPTRHSGCTIDNSCVLTGVCYDQSVLQPIYDFLDKPSKSKDFKDLLEDCLQSLCKDVQGEIEGNSEDEAIKETIEANDYDFTADGKMY